MKIPLVSKDANSKGSRLGEGTLFSHHIARYREHHFQSQVEIFHKWQLMIKW